MERDEFTYFEVPESYDGPTIFCRYCECLRSAWTGVTKDGTRVQCCATCQRPTPYATNHA